MPIKVLKPVQDARTWARMKDRSKLVLLWYPYMYIPLESYRTKEFFSPKLFSLNKIIISVPMATKSAYLLKIYPKMNIVHWTLGLKISQNQNFNQYHLCTFRQHKSCLLKKIYQKGMLFTSFFRDSPVHFSC